MTGAEDKSEFLLKKDTPYLALTGYKMYIVRILGENWLRYNSTTLHYVDGVMIPQIKESR